MGNFYTSFVLKGDQSAAVQKALAGRTAVVAKDNSGFVVVFDEESEGQNEELIEQLAEFLSQECQCAVMAFLNHDDSIFSYYLYDHGVRKDSYNSNPGYFDDGPSEPSGGDAAVVCELFDCADKEGVLTVLAAASGEDYVFETERHAELARLLKHPDWSVGVGFTHIANGEWTDDPAIELVWTRPISLSAAAIPGYYKVVIPNPTAGEEPISLPIGWLPATWETLRAQKSELSERSRQAIAPFQKTFEMLGFRQVAFQKFADILNPNFRDGAGAFYVDESGEIFGQIVYVVYAGASGEIETTTCSFRAVFSNETLVCSNQKPSPLLNPPSFTILFEDTPDPQAVFARFLSEFRKRPIRPKKFENLESIVTQFNLDANVALEERVQKGQYVRMTPFEVWRAKRKCFQRDSNVTS